MICPKCKSEFVPGFTTCSDCGIPLVEFVEKIIDNEPSDAEKYNFVFVYCPISSQELALIKMILEREEIPYFIKNEPLHRAVLFSVHGPGNIKLYVPKQFAKDTISLLKKELEYE